MFKVVNDFNHPLSDGTSRMGEIKVCYKDLILAFGEPMESDGHKVSGEWIFVDEESGECFTLYDWKMTDLYDSSGMSVEALRTTNKAHIINIGGNHKGDVESFKQLVLAQIQYAKVGKPFEQFFLNGKSDKN